MQVVCYFGKAARQGKPALPTDSLLAACEDFARRNELTGLLAVSDGYFLHVLEGEEAAVQNLVARMGAFWDQESPSILFERDIQQRNYPQWSVAISHGSKHRADAADRLGEARRFLDNDNGDAADPFRYFLTPNRTAKSVQSGQPVRQVAIFSNSVLWFNPIFSHLSERFGTQACALKVSNTGQDADSYPLDYADVTGDSAGPVRIVGISEGLLASTLSQPLLEKIELMVFLMRRSGQGTDTAFVARALSHPAVQRCKPRVLFVTPGGNATLSEMLHKMVEEAGLTSTETRGSVLMGGPTWKAIHEQLLATAKPAHKKAKADAVQAVDAAAPVAPAVAAPQPQSAPLPSPAPEATFAVQSVDLELDLPDPSAPAPLSATPPEPAPTPASTPAPAPVAVTVAASIPAEVAVAKPSSSRGKKAAPAPAPTPAPAQQPPAQRSSDLSAAALTDMLERLMYDLDSTTWAGWIDLRTRQFAARTHNAPAHLDEVAESVVVSLEALAGYREPLREMVSTFSEHHEIMVPHPLDSTLVLYLFARLDNLPLATLRRLILDDLTD